MNSAPYEAIEEMAANGFSIDEICEVTELDRNLFADKSDLLYRSYRKGFLRSELELRQRIFKDAKHGSSPAQAMAKKILDDAAYKLRQEEQRL